MRRATLMCLFATACGTVSAEPDSDDAPRVEIGGDRPVQVVVPEGLTGPAPLLMMLHGYTATASLQEIYFRLGPVAEELGFVYAMPEGTVDGRGAQFWNATDACCDFFGTEVDDVGYLSGVIEDLIRYYDVDPGRVYLVGHSNGGFMSHRLACDRADLITGFISLAGAMHLDPVDCVPAEPVHVVQVHGTLDGVIAYEGGTTPVAGGAYPSAAETVGTWADKNGCQNQMALGPIDLTTDADGAETDRAAYDGCPVGGSVSLFTINGGGHIPPLVEGASQALVEYLFAQE